MRAIPLRDPCRLVKNNNSDGSKQAERAHILRLLLHTKAVTRVCSPAITGRTDHREEVQSRSRNKGMMETAWPFR